MFFRVFQFTIPAVIGFCCIQRLGYKLTTDRLIACPVKIKVRQMLVLRISHNMESQ